VGCTIAYVIQHHTARILQSYGAHAGHIVVAGFVFVVKQVLPTAG